VHESLDRALPPPDSGDVTPSDIPPHGVRRDSVWRHMVLFAVTVITTTYIGAFHHLAFTTGFAALDRVVVPDLASPSFYAKGLWYSATILAILGSHEMGHYLACRYYRVDASLPYFLPVPYPFLTGTLGAYIRIRERIPSKIALFDIGLAGPIAGFLIAVPALVGGLAMSRIERIPEQLPAGGAWLGAPLLFQGTAWVVFGNVPDDFTINMHPVAFAAWFGLLATALNLFPISQLDGGHIAYAVFGRRSSTITIAMALIAIALTFYSLSWILWTILMMVMLVLMGPHHPPTLDDRGDLGRTRLIFAFIGLVILVVCFTPAPIEMFVGDRP
jgi:membrane-associated protease RseP (regulator of RpoE activity)